MQLVEYINSSYNISYKMQIFFKTCLIHKNSSL